MKNLFGIMQGRLLPKYKGNFQAHPLGYWEDEFSLASELNFDCIEFILDFNEAHKNPLLSESGLQKILDHSKRNNVVVRSICADYYMTSPIFIEADTTKNENLNILKKLLINSKIIGVKDIIIPLVDNSSVLNNRSKQISAANFLKETIEEFKDLDINICLETDLPPQQFFEFVRKVNKPQIKINYDTGNSVSLGYSFKEEFELYGNLVTNIHLKDRKLNQGSVPLGTGDCDFKNFFQYLSTKEFNGIFVLQAFRENDGLSSLKPQHQYIEDCMKKYYYYKTEN
jgi:L-ribulose-5-phosphate 3-epimerase